MSNQNEKPQTPGVTEVQGQVKVNASNKYIPDLTPLPVTPSGCYLSTGIEWNKDKFQLSVEFTDFNDQGKRPESGDIRLLINTNFNENASNRILACLSFFKWNGQEYIPVSLIEGQDDLKFVVLGNITEFQVKTQAEQEARVLGKLAETHPAIHAAYIAQDEKDEKEVNK